MIQVTLSFSSVQEMLAQFSLASPVAHTTAIVSLPDAVLDSGVVVTPANEAQEPSAPKQRRSRKTEVASTSGAPDTAQAGSADQSEATSAAAPWSDGTNGLSESAQETAATPKSETTADTASPAADVDPLAPAPRMATEEEVRKYAGGRVQADSTFRAKLTGVLGEFGVKALSEIKDPQLFGELLTTLEAI